MLELWFRQFVDGSPASAGPSPARAWSETASPRAQGWTKPAAAARAITEAM